MEIIERINKIIRYLVIIAFLLASVILIVMYIDRVRSGRSWAYSESVQIRDLEICKISYSQNEIPESITVCGNVITEDVARLRINLYKMPGKMFVNENPPKDLFSQGYFTRDISLADNVNYGDYLVEVVLFREVIGSIEFSIGPPAD
jgi:hypothetical protein